MHTLIDANRLFTVDGFYTAFRLDRDGSFVFTGESHDFWEIVFITAGAAEITEDENVYLLGENQMILHAPMEFHRIKSADRQPFGVRRVPGQNILPEGDSVVLAPDIGCGISCTACNTEGEEQGEYE